MQRSRRRVAVTKEKLPRRPLAVNCKTSRCTSFEKEKSKPVNWKGSESSQGKTSWYLLVCHKVHVGGKRCLLVKVIFGLIHFLS